MKEKIKVGFVGLGRRGSSMLRKALALMNDVEIEMICDLFPENLEKAKQDLLEKGRKEPICTTDYRDIVNNPDIDAVFLFTWWKGRIQLTKEFMRAGKYTAIEVGCVESLDDCFELVQIYEETGVPCMLLENVCYGRRELLALNMVKKGLFGEIVHCSGGYCHYLNDCELFLEMVGPEKKDEVTHYRLQHYIDENCENYPTHELGPIAKCIGINRGNRMLTLSSFASKSRGLKQYAKDHFGEDNKYANIDYKQGDIVNTVITCAGGETILMTLDTTLPRPYYSRQLTVRGTKGMYFEDARVAYLDGMPEEIRDNEKEFYEKYEHPLQVEVQEKEPQNAKINPAFGLHADGVDWTIFRAFIDAVKNGVNTPIDTYDTAAWISIGLLSDMSIKQGGAPVEVPDFTNGKWQNREPVPHSKYCLDEVIVDDTVGIYDSFDAQNV